MSACLATETLLGYWFGELAGDEQERVEDHLLGCPSCSERLEALAATGRMVRDAVAAGAIRAWTSAELVEQMALEGLKLRTYRLQPGETVQCSVAPEDDAVISWLGVEVGADERVDAVLRNDVTMSEDAHVEDIPVDRASGAAILAQPGDLLRALPRSTLHVHLVATGPAGSRPLGDYFFAHSPFREGS